MEVMHPSVSNRNCVTAHVTVLLDIYVIISVMIIQPLFHLNHHLVCY